MTGGVSGAINKWLGVNKDKEFSNEVRSKLNRRCHWYGVRSRRQQKTVIYALGADFRSRKVPDEETVEELIDVYKSVLNLFAASQKCLMLVPINGAFRRLFLDNG